MSKLAKVLLVFTSFAPILLTLAFVDWRIGEPLAVAGRYIAIAVLLVLLCALILREASRRLEVFPVQIQSVKAADKEVVGFVLAYLLPLINTGNVARVDPVVLWFVILVLAFVVYTSNSYHFNPLLAFFGYHFYEVSANNHVSYVLITRRDLRSATEVTEVVQLTEYLIMEHRA